MTCVKVRLFHKNIVFLSIPLFQEIQQNQGFQPSSLMRLNFAALVSRPGVFTLHSSSPASPPGLLLQGNASNSQAWLHNKFLCLLVFPYKAVREKSISTHVYCFECYYKFPSCTTPSSYSVWYVSIYNSLIQHLILQHQHLRLF